MLRVEYENGFFASAVLKDDSMQNEWDIIRRVRRGEQNEFRHLVNAHRDKVYAMILRQVADPEIAQELAQETFVKAYMNLEKFENRSLFSTWLIRIAINLTNSYFKSRRYKQSQQTRSLQPHHFKDLIDEKDLDKERQVQALYKVLANLKPRYREIISLCCFERYTYEQAANILEIPYGTVCSRMNKAFALLKKGFQEQAV